MKVIIYSKYGRIWASELADNDATILRDEMTEPGNSTLKFRLIDGAELVINTINIEAVQINPPGSSA